MKARIQDTEALIAVSPVALSAYARAAGWERVETYGDHSDVYAADGMPEIILPRTHLLGDYAYVVSQLIEIFASIADTDELSVYRDLVTADRDVVRVRANGDYDGAVDVNDGIDLIVGAREMYLAAACSLRDPKPLYRTGANREATDYLRRVRMGQTEQGSFIVTLLSPVIPPPTEQLLDQEWYDDPIERRMTKRLSEALTATREATERTVSGEPNAFSNAVKYGASANLCEALAQLVQPFPALDVSLVWSLTRPMPEAREVFHFAQNDTPIWNEAARSFRSREPKLDERLFGFVQRLKRDESEMDGTITLRASIEGKTESVTAVLNQTDYERAIQVHKDRVPIIAEGDLERIGQRWRLLNPRITEIILDDE